MKRFIKDLKKPYKNQTAFLIGSGPSTTPEMFELLKTPGLLTMCTNNSVKLIRPRLCMLKNVPPRFLMSTWLDPAITKITNTDFSDSLIWDSYNDKIADILVSDCPDVVYCNYAVAESPDQFFKEDEVIISYHNLENPIVDKDTGEKHFAGRCVSMASIDVLVQLGVTTINIVGMDFYKSQDKPYVFNQALSQKRCHLDNRVYKGVNAFFKELRPLLEQKGIRVFNCTPGGDLTAFERKDLKDAVEEAMPFKSVELDDPVKLFEDRPYYNRGIKQ